MPSGVAGRAPGVSVRSRAMCSARWCRICASRSWGQSAVCWKSRRALYTAASRRSVWWVIGSPGGGAAAWWGRPRGWVRSGGGGGLVVGAVRAEVAAVALAHPAVALGFASPRAGRAGGRQGGVVPWLAAAVAEDERAEEGGHGGLLSGWVGSAAGPGRYARPGPPAITGRAQRTGRAGHRGGCSTT